MDKRVVTFRISSGISSGGVPPLAIRLNEPAR